MAFVVKDRVRVATAGTGTGTITLGSAVQNAARGYYRTFAAAGVANGDTVPYLIEDGANWETGIGTYASAGPVLTRTAVINNSAGTTSPISLSGAAEVGIVLTEQVLGLLLRNDLEGQSISGGASVVSKELVTGGNLSGVTLVVTPAARSFQHGNNNGGFIWNPPTVAGACMVDITNVSGAGAITLGSWTAIDGDAFDTTVGSKFRCHVSLGNAGSYLTVKKLI